MTAQIALKYGWILSRDLMKEELDKLPKCDPYKGRDVSSQPYWLWIDHGPLVGGQSVELLKSIYEGVKS